MENHTLTLRTAQRRVNEYASESDSLMAAHKEAMDCRDCEAFLEIGIEAFEWLVRATNELRNLELKDGANFDADDIIRGLRQMWLRPCNYASEWASIQMKRGFEVDIFRTFVDCCTQMRRIIDEDEKIQEIAKRVPTAEELSTIAISPPQEWLNEPSWSK